MTDEASSPRSLLWRALGLLAVFATLQLTWQSLHGTAVETFIVHTCTVVPAAFLANLLTPGVHAQAVQFSLRAPGGGLNILNGCEGIEALFLLVGAFSVASAPWRTRLAGLAVGVPVVFLVNQVRILTLFYAYRADHALFDPLHAMVTPVVAILLIAGYYYAWLVHASHRVSTS